MKDWDEPLDKGPPIVEPNKHHKKAYKGQKPFVIEERYIGPERQPFMAFFYNREWKLTRRYATSKQRGQAFRALQHRRENSHAIYKQWEYRSVDL